MMKYESFENAIRMITLQHQDAADTQLKKQIKLLIFGNCIGSRVINTRLRGRQGSFLFAIVVTDSHHYKIDDTETNER